ncbi:hypothetical protein F5884DRAFT_857581 [Xylogone sp. PMI_703]|nr:hypothetical protein F5884DRAFT_857581 [Xylogone sp. PMI_703]
MMLLMQLISLFAILLSTRLWSVAAAEQTRCGGCVDAKFLRANVYGIDLSIEYIAVAAKYVNGTRAPIARISTSDEYRSLMRQWLSDSDLSSSASSYGHGHIPIENIECIPQLTTQNRRLPTSTRIIAEEINNAIQTLTRNYNQNIYDQRVGISVPLFITPEQATEVREAAHEAGLGRQYAFGSSDILGSLAADTRFYTTYLEWQLTQQHKLEEKQNQRRTTLVLEYNALTLTGSLIYRHSNNGTDERISYFVDATLGSKDSWKLDGQGIRHQDRVTSRITGLIQDAIETSQRMDPPLSTPAFDFAHLKVLIQGEKGHDARFRRTVGEALLPLVVTWGDMRHWESLVDIKNGDLGILSPDEEHELVFNSALGAAHSGKWYLDEPSPPGCVEDTECRERRKWVLLDAIGEGRMKVQIDL